MQEIPKNTNWVPVSCLLDCEVVLCCLFCFLHVFLLITIRILLFEQKSRFGRTDCEIIKLQERKKNKNQCLQFAQLRC